MPRPTIISDGTKPCLGGATSIKAPADRDRLKDLCIRSFRWYAEEGLGRAVLDIEAAIEATGCEAVIQCARCGSARAKSGVDLKCEGRTALMEIYDSAGRTISHSSVTLTAELGERPALKITTPTCDLCPTERARAR